MKIGIDIDEVITKFIEGYLKIYNEKYDKRVCFEDVITYDLWECLSISEQEAYKISDEFYDSKDFENVNFIEGAKDSINELSKNNEVILVTSRPLKIRGKTEKFFKENFPNNNFKILFSGDRFGKGKSKLDICEEEAIGIIIEDEPKYALSCAQKGIKVFLLDKPWNQDIEHENVVRVNNWKQVMELLK
jgi:uncharacterized HAD superfamily protein